MADWQRHLRLSPEWQFAQAGSVSPSQLAGVIASRLNGLAPFADEMIEDQREELVEWFKELADEDPSPSEFNEAMAALYDWGDTSLDGRWNGRKVCWIDTFGAKR